MCAAKIRAERAEELTKAVGDWLAGGGAVYMVTTTVRHSRRDDVQSLTRWLCKAWSATIRGAPWKRWRSRTGTVAYVRAMEVMLMGPSGPHPHLHVLLFTSGPLASFQYQRAVHWLRERWRDSVRKCFPSTDLYNADLDRHGRHWRHEPTLSAGVNVLRVRAGEGASYISKMGCEMSGISKRGKRGAVDPWGVLNRAADGDPVAAVEWCAYSSGVRGMRLHTWSRGGRAALGLVPDVDDEALAEVVTHERVCVLTGDAWDLLARSVGAARVFDAAESSRGRADVLALVATHCGRTVAAECWEATTRAGPDPWDCILLPGVVKCDHESEAPNAR
ncbi:MAG: hypothetical protein GY953_46945 [bacterium]|nr:hypothetical protein [bacterium]